MIIKSYFLFTRYTIDDLKGEKQFLVNMDISVCFEAHGPCVLKIPILTEVRLPKPLCNLESGFSFPSKYKSGTFINLHQHISLLKEIMLLCYQPSSSQCLLKSKLASFGRLILTEI